ncbi:MAG: hypothetical protein MIO93_04980 [ANME-2 cluster archaeon]|nr:hypothetical protein [ANME-2 cluster archaeon]
MPVSIQVAHHYEVLFIRMRALGIFNHRTKSINFWGCFIGVCVDDNECGIEVAAQCFERCDIRLSVEGVSTIRFRYVWGVEVSCTVCVL